MRAFLKRLDDIPENVLLVGASGMAAFVLVSHTGAWLLRDLPGPEYAELVTRVTRVTIPTCLVLMGASALAIFQPQRRAGVLGFYGVVLSVFSLGLWAWAVSLVVWGLPEGRFAWTPGFLTTWNALSAYLLRRFAVPSGVPGSLYLPILAAGVTLPVDAAVGLMFFTSMANS
jgi:hypothetical protein